jgi:two-component system, cell cycle sensor histidine kinase and response regulator CckA
MKTPRCKIDSYDDKESIDILHLEDSNADADLVARTVKRDGLRCQITRVSDRSQFEAQVAGRPFDLILSDHGIPGYDGFAALRFAQQTQPSTPVIMLSGSLDDAQAVESLKCGATDYILKQKPARLVSAIRRALQEVKDREEKKKLEAAFLRSQRMDTIGALAGGIAHDLNNALAPILMSAELMKSAVDEKTRESFLEIISASAQRATGMVRQILGFARGRDGTAWIPVGHIIGELGKIVRDTFPKSISISLKPGGKTLWQIRGDATELHQVLLNLCVNARDAMPHGGKITVSAENVKLDQETAIQVRASAGPHVVLSVEDTGTGIPAEVMPRIFEPFFTTKLPESGTGLGLSTVATIVKHFGGSIHVETELGKGTTFKIYLPAIESSTEEKEAKLEEVTLPVGHNELILVIEDEETVCQLIKTTLENYGYRVITAQNGLQGIARFDEHKHEIKVLITDTDMPHLDGMGAIDAIKSAKPDLPVIVASGSKHNTTQERKMAAGRVSKLGKPFSVEQLLIAVGLVLQH